MATPLNIAFSEEDFKERVSYDELEDGGEYVGTLTSVEDVEARTGNTGWKFIFDVQGLPVNGSVWHSGGGKWKIREYFNALGQPIEPGTNMAFLDPNGLIGAQCVVTIEKTARDDGDGYWTNVGRVTPYVSEPTTDFSDL